MTGVRLAGAPISWGVCEVPGWGYQVPAERVLREMADLGLAATEFGPDGFLPADPAERAGLLGRYGLTPAGGFVPVVLHRPDVSPLAGLSRALDSFGPPCGAVLVVAAATGTQGYESRPPLTEDGWQTLLANLDRAAAYAAGRGYATALHPHVGTMVATRTEVERVLAGSQVPLCLDTGHLLIGGTDPAWLARQHAERVAHVHLKDVDAGWARRVAAGEVSYAAAVGAGLYRPLGRGDVDVRGAVAALESAGYSGWYVLEQDRVLAGAPNGDGPAADVRASLGYLRETLR